MRSTISTEPSVGGQPVRRATLLIVDDAPTVRTSLWQMLSPEYTCVCFPDGESALRAALTQPPDLIVSDVLMEPIDGYELCRQVRREPTLANTPLILLTSANDPDGRAIGLEGGADDYLRKPVRERELLARVRSLLGLRTAQLEILQKNAELSQAHEEVLRAQRQLLEAEKLATLGAVASGIAHEINNPLAFAMSGVQQLVHAVGELTAGQGSSHWRPPEKVLAEIGEIKGEVLTGLERIANIVSDLSHFASSRDRARTWLDVQVEIERAITIARSKLMTVSIERRYEHSLPVYVAPGYLAQVAFNLIANAAEAVVGVELPSVQVTTRDHDNGVEFTVTDNGVGMSNEILPRIFDPFFTSKRAGAGTGLGLSVCLGLVKRLGGEIRAASQAGKGSTLRVWIPSRTDDSFTALRVQTQKERGQTRPA
ncbi:MAG TPA: ATP-binding protein [Myxococcaceae bacterium]|nr:ATP-binding protein [Myxococcaceae bacterium]